MPGLIILLALFSIDLFAGQDDDWQLLSGMTPPELVGDDALLQQEAHEAFQQMQQAALADGISLTVVSAYRSFEHQREIWNRKYLLFTETEKLSPMEAINKIITYSSLPGTSRHHWGTEIDLIDGNIEVDEEGHPLLAKQYHGEGAFADMRQWMDSHASRFGFYLVYTDDPERKGFFYEPWHYTYKPLSQPLFHQFMELNNKNAIFSEQVLGSEFFTEEFLLRYRQENLLDINPLVK